MARQQRVHLHGGIYHVMLRGNGGMDEDHGNLFHQRNKDSPLLGDDDLTKRHVRISVNKWVFCLLPKLQPPPKCFFVNPHRKVQAVYRWHVRLWFSPHLLC